MEAFDEQVYRPLIEDDEGGQARTLEDEAEKAAKSLGLDWQDDVKPLLGNDIAIAISGQPLGLLSGSAGDEFSVVLALETAGGDIEEVLKSAEHAEAGDASGATLYREEYSDDATIAVEDGVLVVSSNPRDLRPALERRDSGDGLAQEAVDDALADLPAEYFVRGFGTLDQLADQEELRRFAELPLVRRSSPGPQGAVRANGSRSRRAADAEQIEEATFRSRGEMPEIVLRDRRYPAGTHQSRQTFSCSEPSGRSPTRARHAADAIEKGSESTEQELLDQSTGRAPRTQTRGRRSPRERVRDPESLRECCRDSQRNCGPGRGA